MRHTRFAFLSIFAALLIPIAAHADDDVIVLPAPLVNQIATILSKAPWDQIDATMTAIRGCVAVQTVKNGVTVSHGECPDVSQWLAQHPLAPPALADKRAPGNAPSSGAAPVPAPAKEP
jgi:hypothetical protein